MTTASRRIIRETNHVRTAERFLGGRLEDTLKPYLNETGTMSDLASAVGVQKATVNYWIMRLGIKYARVAYDENEEVRVYSRADAEVADAAIESGLDAEELQSIDKTAFDAFAEMQKSDRKAMPYTDLSSRDLRTLEAIKQVADDIQVIDDDPNFPDCLKAAVALSEQRINPEDINQLTHSDVRVVAHLKEIGAEWRDVKRLDRDSIDHLRSFEAEGMQLEDFADFNIPRLRALKRAESSGLKLERLADLSQADLDLLAAIRQAGWDDDAKLKSDLALLDNIREAGLDDPGKLDAAKRLIN